MHTTLCVAYFAVLLFLSAYGIHRSHLVFQCWRHRRRLEQNVRLGRASVSEDELPTVTVQLPLFNEATVAVRLLEAVAQFDYPREKLEIQVLDDSTDETQMLARTTVERLAAEGVDMVYLHRTDRSGYKAGALAEGLKVAKGELVAVFDADFVPQPGFIRDIVPHFVNDGRVGMVQTRWGHMNRDFSLLTQVQALMLDGHHLVENRARFGAGNLFNFSGTGGMWRKQAILDAGGWEHDTLTEDLDLSYRAQLAGWRFVYREDVVSPAELPEDVSAFRAQQYRWAKGTVQTSRKLIKRVLTAPLTLSQRAEAFFHLTPHFAYPLMVTLSVLLLPALICMPATDPKMMLLVDLPLVIGTTGSLSAFYMLAESAQGRSRWGALARLPMLIALGAGLAPHLTKAVFEGLTQMHGEFVRTPKKGSKEGRYRARAALPMTEIVLALISFAAVIASIQTRHFFATPFAMLFTFGYGYIALLVASEQATRRREAVTNVLPNTEVMSERPAAMVDEMVEDIAALRPALGGGRASRPARKTKQRGALSTGSGAFCLYDASSVAGGIFARGRPKMTTKAEIVGAVHERIGGFSKKEAADLVDLVFETMKETLGRGEKIKISGFGNFVLRDKHSRQGRNPQTGDPIVITERRVLTFKSSQILKQVLNRREPTQPAVGRRDAAAPEPKAAPASVEGRREASAGKRDP